MQVSQAWRGYGSAIFLEFGALTPRSNRDGTPGNPDGELSLMIEWSWRIEEAGHIVCGSWGNEELWEPWLKKLVGRVVLDVEVFGRLPEVMLSLSGHVYLASFMTAEGDPQWVLIDHRENGLPALRSERGRIVADH